MKTMQTLLQLNEAKIEQTLAFVQKKLSKYVKHKKDGLECEDHSATKPAIFGTLTATTGARITFNCVDVNGNGKFRLEASDDGGASNFYEDDGLSKDDLVEAIDRVLRKLEDFYESTVNEAIKGEGNYQWMTYNGPTMSLARRNKEYPLKNGMVYGVRPSTSGKAIRLILKDEGPSIVFTIDAEEAALLAKRSKPANGKASPIPKADLIKRGKKAVKAAVKFVKALAKSDPKKIGSYDPTPNMGDDITFDEVHFDPASKAFYIQITLTQDYGETGSTNWFEVEPLGKVTLIKARQVPKKTEEIAVDDLQESVEEVEGGLVEQLDTKNLQPGWYVVDKKDRPIDGPFKEAEAEQKAKAKGLEATYFSDYAIRRMNEDQMKLREATESDAEELEALVGQDVWVNFRGIDITRKHGHYFSGLHLSGKIVKVDHAKKMFIFAISEVRLNDETVHGGPYGEVKKPYKTAFNIEDIEDLNGQQIDMKD